MECNINHDELYCRRRTPPTLDHQQQQQQEEEQEEQQEEQHEDDEEEQLQLDDEHADRDSSLHPAIRITKLNDIPLQGMLEADFKARFLAWKSFDR